MICCCLCGMYWTSDHSCVIAGEKKKTLSHSIRGFSLLLSFSYVPDTLLLTCHCWKTKLCIWRFSLLLFRMYLTQFYSDVIAEKTDCLRIWGFDLLLFHMYLTHFYSHGIAKKKHCLCIWGFDLLLSFWHMLDTHSLTWPVYLGSLICYCVIGTYTKQIVEKPYCH